jgi:hypothetical protein
MTQQEIKKLASEIIGDGQLPNKFFVTESPNILVTNEFGDKDYETIEGFEGAPSYTYGPFDTYEEALAAYNDSDLDFYDGVGSIMIEDRLTGTIQEKALEKVVRTDYSYVEYDDSKRFGYKK